MGNTCFTGSPLKSVLKKGICSSIMRETKVEKSALSDL